jgi:hypothetical protein
MVMVGAANVPTFGTAPPGDAGGNRHVSPFADGSSWTDPLDDLSHVYVNATMPVGIEVTGGDAHLVVGVSNGWLASEIIACPPGFRYDLVLLDVDAPGKSYVNVTVLNASAVPTVDGFANGTIQGFELVDATDVSLNHIDAAYYPGIRIQVDLHAVGSDRPRLLSWTVIFVDVGEWREEFLGTGKMIKNRNLNLSGDGVRISLDPSKLQSVAGEYEPYPTMAWVRISNYLYLLYPLENRTGYQDAVRLDVGDSYTTSFADLDRDGYMDLVVGGYNAEKSRILWGDDTGTYSLTPARILDVSMVEHVVPGDYNGDGWTDLMMVTYELGMDSTCIFFNDGNGTFNLTYDIVLQDRYAIFGWACDLNGDKYDDFVLSSGGTVWGYHCGPNGPSAQPEFTIAKDQGKEATVADLDQDGYVDIVIYGVLGTITRVYMGGPFGIDDDPDYWISEPPGTIFTYNGHCGDLNGDGYMEIVIPFDSVAGERLFVYPGSANGWNTSVKYSIDIGRWPRVTIFDVDKDGYDDILLLNIDNSVYALDIFKGGESWPTTRDIRKTGVWNCHPPISVSVPRASDIPLRFKATFTTENIHLPDGMRWDIMDMKSTIPENTSISFMVLNETGSAITDELPWMNTDLSSIISATQRTVSFKITLSSTDVNFTPALDSVLVNWVDEMTWRDEFYGPEKVDRLFDLKVVDGLLQGAAVGGKGPQLIIPSFRDDMTFNSMSFAHRDGGALDYMVSSPLGFQTTGAVAASVADVNGDGHLDVAFASYATSEYDLSSTSQVFLGSPVGWRDLPDRTFNTTGARDVLLEDLDGDGHVDLVIAQEQDGVTYGVDSFLFWGSSDGWAEKPDVRFKTRGASGIVAEDLDGDGLLDLVFACYSPVQRTTDSMVFIQDEDGFDGAVADHLLNIEAAVAVGAGDLNGDDLPDLVFANSQSDNGWETDSRVYLAKAGGGFETTPLGLPTKGAQDVKVADLDNDGDLDIVFANLHDDAGNHALGSPVYLNDGTGGFPAIPSHTLTTMGAVAVEVADLDGTGWKDLVFACYTNGTSYSQTSVGYLGGSNGWSSTPDIEIPTDGASDVVAAHLFEPGDCAYMSQSITPRDLDNTGGFHSLSYNASLDGVTGTIHVFDAVTWEEVASKSIATGAHEWDLRGQVYFKDHNSIRVVVSVEGMEASDAFQMDDLYVNWTERVRAPPSVVDIHLSASSVLRTGKVAMLVNVTDEYDPPEDLTLMVEHRLEGDPYWYTDLVDTLEFIEGVWKVELFVSPTVPIGNYSFRVMAHDKDNQESDFFEAVVTLEVLNNIPTAPEIILEPQIPLTTTRLSVSITRSARDIEGTGLTYLFKWFRNGIVVTGLTSDYVDSEHTTKEQNWSVEVRAFDGDDEGPPAMAWVVIGNSAPYTKAPVEDIVIQEDGSDDSLLLSQVFQDPDVEPLEYSIVTMPEHVVVEIEELTGQVRITPEADWSGFVNVTFWATDGEFTANLTVIVQVRPVNDAPFFVDEDGNPVGTDKVVVTIEERHELVLTFFVFDKEGDRVRAQVDSDLVELHEEDRWIILPAANAHVGSITFTLTIWDVERPNVKVTREFEVVVENVNDPMGSPSIRSPSRGSHFEVNESIDLRGVCNDPDTQYGQVLNFSWESNVSGPLGHGQNLTVSFDRPGTYLITLTVRDPEFARNVSIEIIIDPPEEVTEPPQQPPPDDGGDGGVAGIDNMLLAGIVAALLIAVGATVLVLSRRKARVPDEEEDAVNPLDYLSDHGAEVQDEEETSE